MKSIPLILLASSFSANAFAARLVCKGGLLSAQMDRFSVLEKNRQGTLVGYKADRRVAGYTFQVVETDDSLELTIKGPKGHVVAKSNSASTVADLTVSLSRGLSASVFCGEE